jgi:hypothetical protein
MLGFPKECEKQNECRCTHNLIFKIR